MLKPFNLQTNNIKIYKVIITDKYKEVFELEFIKNKYTNLMSLISEYYPEEF